VVCVAATDCAGTDSICHKRICGNQYTCGFSNAPAGTAAEPDATGNCAKAVCDDTGGVTSAPDINDVPADDGNSCTDDTCTTSGPAHPAKPAGTACSQNGGSFCSGTTCVQCAVAADCPGSDTICRKRTCDGNHLCGHMDEPLGTAAGTDDAGNCQTPICDGAGAVKSGADDNDLPVDGNACTKDVCTNGTPSNPKLPAGTTCSTDGSKSCDANAQCNTLTFRVVRIGPGTSSAATAVTIDEVKTDGTIIQSVGLPTAAAGANHQLTMSGSAKSEGCLSLSADGHHLALAGYGVDTGTASVKGTAGKRVAGLIDIAGTVNTSMLFATGDSGDNVRGATTLDGVDVWISGAGSGTNGGIWYQSAVTGGEKQIVASPSDTRCPMIFDGQLYVSASNGSSTGVFTVGLSTPTTTGQGLTLLNNLTVANPYGYAIFDLPDDPNGVADTIYVADEAAGLLKWTSSDGMHWTAAPTALNIAGNAGFRGVAGYAVGKTVTLMASTAESAMNHLVVFVDNNDGTTPTGASVAQAQMNMIFRGVAVSPHFAAPPP
jgi:hypothetical protein